MTSIGYIEPQEFITRQLVGRANVGILADNDQYFYGLARGNQPVPMAASIDTAQKNLAVWDGHILYEGDLRYLKYNVSGNADVTTYLRIGYPDDWAASNETIVNGTNSTDYGDYDMLNTDGTRKWTAGSLLRVYCYVTCTGVIHDPLSPVATCRPPFLWGYTGSEVWRQPYILSDGRTSSAAQFNRLRTNDLYFWTNRPRQAAFSGMKRTSSSDLVIWRGYTHHKWHQLNYYVYLSENNDDNKLTIRYDDGGDNDTSQNIAAEGYTEASKTINQSSDWMLPRKLLTVTLDIGTGPTTTAEVLYLYLAPSGTYDMPSSEAWSSMSTLSPNQWVYGDTPSQRTRLDSLRVNDDYIFKYMNWRATVGRMDFVTAMPYVYEINDLGANAVLASGEFRLIRRGDTLYYRTEGAQMTWGGSYTHALDDYDSSNPYRTLDLNTLGTLEYGQIYRIRADEENTELYYAMEK